MNYYFMMRHPGLAGRVTLSNFPCVDGQGIWSREAGIYAAWSDGSAWQIRKLGSLAPARSVSIHEKDLPPDCPSGATPFLFLCDNSLASQIEVLPDLADRETQPEWRANIELHSLSTAASYQGEYGSAMAAISAGSLLCLCPFLQGGAGITTSLIFVNLQLTPDIRTAKIEMVDVTTKASIGHAEVRTNHCSVIPLDPDKIAFGKMFAVTSTQVTGIPLLLTHNADYTQMSLEHTHPPAEMFLFGDRASAQRTMKANWFRGLGR